MYGRSRSETEAPLVVLLLVLLVARLRSPRPVSAAPSEARKPQARRHRQGRRVRRDLQGEGEHPHEDALPGEAAAGNQAARNIALAGARPRRQEGQPRPGAPVLEEQRLQHRHGRQAHRRLRRGFGENVYRQMSKMEFILQALTYPQIGKIIYRSAHSDLNQAIADFKAAIAQHVSVIVSYPDFGDAMLPV